MKWILIFCSLLSILFSCTLDENKVLVKKNRCFNEKLKKLRQDSLYIAIQNQFKDTFQVLFKREPELNFRENKIDESVFFNEKRDKAILIILQKPHKNTNLFGRARTVEAIRTGKNWNITFSRVYIFENDYKELFEKNSFENLALIARYCVLIDGNVDIKGCEVDERYWFQDGTE